MTIYELTKSDLETIAELLDIDEFEVDKIKNLKHVKACLWVDSSDLIDEIDGMRDKIDANGSISDYIYPDIAIKCYKRYIRQYEADAREEYLEMLEWRNILKHEEEDGFDTETSEWAVNFFSKNHERYLSKIIELEKKIEELARSLDTQG